MASLSEQLLTLSRRAQSEPALCAALLGDTSRALTAEHVQMPDGVTARAEYHDGYGLYIELSGRELAGDPAPVSAPPASEHSTLDCLHY